MNKNKNKGDKELVEFSSQFNNTIQRIYEAVGSKAFRIGKFNNLRAPFYDAFMVAVASNEEATAEVIKKAHCTLKNCDEFFDLTRSGTTATYSVTKRIEMAKDVLNASF